ncbi:MAG: DUF2232 domain-containing protein [Gammaproteobacteria bacterium]|nr:DUF2232 domain-containing protein [Gammaproteobacteria bacterium]
MVLLARFLMRSQLNAVLVISVTALLSLIMPPTALLSGGAVALVVLKQNSLEGLKICLMSLLGCGLLAYLVIGVPTFALAMAMAEWLPMLIVASVMQQTRSLGLAILSVASIAVLGLAGLYLWVGDPAAMWLQVLNEIIRPVLEKPESGFAVEQVDQVITEAARFMSGALAASLVLSLSLSFLLARWWHAVLDNPGGFQEEFHHLRFGKAATVASFVVFVIAMALQQEFLLSMAIVFLTVFLFQGMAVAHAMIKLKGKSLGWLVAMYVAMFITPQFIVFVVLLGWLDTWIDIRQRYISNAV